MPHLRTRPSRNGVLLQHDVEDVSTRPDDGAAVHRETLLQIRPPRRAGTCATTGRVFRSVALQDVAGPLFAPREARRDAAVRRSAQLGASVDGTKVGTVGTLEDLGAD